LLFMKKISEAQMVLEDYQKDGVENENQLDN
jgi:hypothetical protein